MIKRRTHMVVLQRRGSAQDEVGQTREVWSELRREWASIEPISGREFFAASGERAEVTHRLRVAYGSGVMARDRALSGSRIFDIRSVINVEERNRELELMCTEVVS